MKIYDCFLFNDENQLLEVRLNELNSFVDYFVIVESEYNHQNKLKGKKINLDILNAFKDKIKYSYIKGKYSFKDSWQIENYQRNFIKNSLKECSGEDIIIVSDIDEIPNLENINFHQIENKMLAFAQLHMMYKFNLLREKKWFGTKLIKFKNLKNPQWIRSLKVHKKYSLYRIDKIFFSNNYYSNFEIIVNGGWHFGWLKNLNEILLKINSFAHTEYLNTKINNKEYIEYCLLNNLNFFNKKKLDLLGPEVLPNYVKNNLKKFKNFIL